MRVGYEDGMGSQFVQLSKPILAAIDHDHFAPVRNGEGAVPCVSIASGLDVPPSAEKGQFHPFKCPSASSFSF
jgi:hypothetical protein